MNNPEHLHNIKTFIRHKVSYKEYCKACKEYGITPCHPSFYK